MGVLRFNGVGRKRLRFNSFAAGIDAYADESVMPLSTAKECYNLEFRRGALRQTMGISLSEITDSVKSVWQYRRTGAQGAENITMFCDSAGRVKYIENGAVKTLSGITFSGRVRAVNYRLEDSDVIIMMSDTESMAVWDGVNPAYTVADAPRITSMALHGERLFVTDARDSQSVRFSDDLNPTNWSSSLTEGGYITLTDERGKLNKVIDFLNYVYIFRDFGISRLYGTGGQTSFSVTNMYVSSGRIYPDTVALCGDRVLFLAGDGLYRFDGINTVRVLPQLDGMILPDENARGAYCRGKYYLACRIAGEGAVGCESGMYKNNAVIEIDVSKGEFTLLRGADVSEICPVGEKPYFVCDGKAGVIDGSGALFGTPLGKKWRSPLSDFNSERIKILREICFFAEGSGAVTVNADGNSESYNFVSGFVRIAPKLRGRLIGITFSSSAAEFGVNRVSLLYDEL